ncbi:alpha/beta fold hydrolase [Pseudomonas sp. PWP3-1b2]|uniref:alpha/beta fold hydrolase n=1 Tax=Pseudomonas sp. PWP3-1b2 TaxID=2804656 RepID=UPI003CF67373
MTLELRERGIYTDGDPSKPSLVLLHSIATSSEIWLPLLPLLTQRFYVIRVDLPGHGRAPRHAANGSMDGYARYVDDILNELRTQPAAMLGISLGGMVAQAYALAHPGLLRALVLANCGAITPKPVQQLWQSRIEAVIANGMSSQIQDTLARWFTPAFTQRSPMCLEWIGKLIATTSSEGYIAAAKAIQQLDHLEMFSKIDIPTLILAGDQDAAIPLAALELMSTVLPSAKLHILQDVGHLSAAEAPTVFAETVGAFLKSAVPV